MTILNELEFRSLIKDLPESLAADIAAPRSKINKIAAKWRSSASVTAPSAIVSVGSNSQYICAQDEAALQQVVAALELPNVSVLM